MRPSARWACAAANKHPPSGKPRRLCGAHAQEYFLHSFFNVLHEVRQDYIAASQEAGIELLGDLPSEDEDD